MAITDLQPNPKRIGLGFPLTSLIHDDCHDWVTPFNIMAAAVNSIVSSGGGIPAGVVEMFAGTTLPPGYLWCDGTTVSQATYAALYTAIGTTWNVGGETAGTFRLPKPQGRVPMCANPLNGTSADTPTLTTRTLAVKYGAETVAYTPGGSILASASITGAPGIGTLAVSAVSASITNPAISVTGGVLSGTPTASMVNPTITTGIGTLAVSPVSASITNPAIVVTVNESGGGANINTENVTPTLNYSACVQLTEGESAQTFPPCDITVNTFNVPIAKTSITGALDISASITNPAINVTGGILSGAPTASITDANITTGIGTLSVSAISASITNPAINVTGGVLSGAPSAGTLGANVTANFTGTLANISTIQPVTVFNFIIKY